MKQPSFNRLSVRFNIAFRRAVAFLTCLTFTLTSVHSNVQAAPAPLAEETPLFQKPLDPASINIPQDLARIEDRFQGKSPQTLILIQDAHSIPSAQKKIRDLITYFQREYGVSQVALEGASTPLDPQFFRSFPDQERLTEVLNKYMERGELSGASAAAILGTEQSAWRTRLPARQVAHGVRTSVVNSRSALSAMRSAEFVGVEDWALYEKGLRLYQEAMSREEELDKALSAERMALDQKKQEVYSKELLEIDEKLEDFYNNKTDLLEILRTLSKIQPPKTGGSLDVLLKSSKENPAAAAIEIKKIGTEVQKKLRQLPKKAQPDLVKLNQIIQAFRNSEISVQAAAQVLKDLIHQYHLTVSISEGFLASAENEQRLAQIQGTKLMREFEEYSERIIQGLMKIEVRSSKLEKKAVFFQPPTSNFQLLHAQTKELRLLKRLAKLELTREEWNEIQTIDHRLNVKPPDASNSCQGKV